MTELQECIRSGGLSTQAVRSILILTSTGITHTVYLNPRWLAGVIVWTGILLCLILLFSSKLQAYTDYFRHRQHNWKDAIFCTCTYLFSTQLLALHTSSFGASRTQLPSSTSLTPTLRLSRSLSM